MDHPKGIYRHGDAFQWGDAKFTVLADEIEFFEEPHPCIRELGKKRTSKLVNAIKLGLIKKAEETLFPEQEDEPIPKKKTEYSKKSSKTAPVKEPNKSQSRRKTGAPKAENATSHEFYLPVSPLRARIFLSHGLIFPSTFDPLGGKNFGDIHDGSDDALIMFTRIQSLDAEHPVLHISALPDELDSIDHKRGTALLTMPLPLSRLKGIGVRKTASELESYILGWTYPDVPVNPSLFFSLDEKQITRYPDGDIRRRPESSVNISVSRDALGSFDRILGMLAYARNASLYLSERSESLRGLPQTIISVLDALKNRGGDHASKEIPALLSRICGLTESIDSVIERMFDLVYNSRAIVDIEKVRPIMIDIYDASSKSAALGNAFKNLRDGDYRTAVRNLQHTDIPFEARALAVLLNFGDRNSYDYRNVKQRLHDDWKDEHMLAEALAVLGAYYGYTKLDAKETQLYSLHPTFTGLVSEQPDIKFYLRNNFERRLIETVYQHSFHNRPVPDSLFEKIGFMQQTSVIPPVHKDLPNAVIDESFVYEDLVVDRFSIRKETSLTDILHEVHPRYLDESSETGTYLLKHVFFRAERYHLSKDEASASFGYRMDTARVVEMIKQKQFPYDEEILRLALKKDGGRHDH